MAACLATGGVASHRCAAFLWKFRKFERPVVEVLVAKGHTPKLAGVTVRRTTRLDPDERTQVGAIPVTTRARTLLDLVPWLPSSSRARWTGRFTSVAAHAAKEDVQRNAEKADDLLE